MKKTFKVIVLQSLIFMGLLFVLSLVLRGIFIAYFSEAIKGVSLAEFRLFVSNFLRYDGQIIGVLSVIFFVLNFTPKQALIKLYALLVILITAFVGIANIGFYEIYQDAFNGTLLGLFFDDKKAILETAIGGDFGFTGKILLWLGISLVFYALFAFLHAQSAKIQGKKFRIVLFIGFGLCCLFSINGHIGLKGISLSKEITPVSNTFLRKITHGGFRDLLYVYRSYKLISNSSFADFTNEAPLAATRAFFGLKDENESEFDLAKLLQKEVNNPSKAQIQHIFYIIAESFSAWHLDEDMFEGLGTKSELLEFVKESGAYKADIFLQNATRTIDSLNVQISSLFYTGIPLSLSVGKSPVFRMSPGYIFKDLGYKTSFFYGGSGTWYKIDNYTKSQGFDEIKFSNHIVNYAEEKGLELPFENSWGAFDHHLFEFIKDYTLASKDTKSFAMIMTTSNHGPWDAPVEKFGVDFEKINNFLKAKQLPQDEHHRKIFSHIIYQDKVLAQFVRETAKALPNSLFVITGDHISTSFFPQSKHKDQVPFIVYSPILKPFVLSNVGSHIDITATITELVAPNAYKYASFGSPLLSNGTKNVDKNSNQSPFALGFNSVANKDFIYDGHKIEYFKDLEIQGENAEFQAQKAKIQGKTPNLKSKAEFKDDESIAKAMFENLKRARALSWWIINKGYIIKDK